MRIAIPYDLTDGTLFHHSGRAEAFLIAEAAEGASAGTRILSAGSTAHEGLVSLLKQEGVDLLLCGGAGPGMRQALQAAGISFLSGNAGSAEAVLEDFLAGRLALTLEDLRKGPAFVNGFPAGDAQCDCHEHEPGEGQKVTLRFKQGK